MSGNMRSFPNLSVRVPFTSSCRAILIQCNKWLNIEIVICEGTREGNQADKLGK
ncbi:MAG TPA: hypothetical protein VLG49_02235 [Rhabdochlamydiaceae bacterium]|nr:hypothetical protein [Rhabdochlamydiaceae bacterium]